MRIIDNKYEVLEKLGEGFGGSVYLVQANGQKSALKELRMKGGYQYLSAEEVLDNFKQEFATLKKLNHPHILRILDFGFDPQEKIYYFTTEYIKGQDIFDATRGLTPDAIEELFVQTLRALSYLHSVNIFHFDIKPTNILVETNTEGKKVAKIIDFGLTALQKKGVLAGSPPYISPEALLDQPRDGRSDLYSLGVTWYTCLSGKNPFETDDLQKTLDLQRVWIPPPVSTQTAEIPEYLDSIVEKLLKKNPAERYHRADQVVRDLNWSGKKKYPLETEATALSYLPGESELVGRKEEWNQFAQLFDRIFLNKSESKGLLFLTGQTGTGKSRLLKEFKYHAQLHTIAVLDFESSTPSDIKCDCVLIADNVGPEIIEKAKHWMRQFHTYSLLIILGGEEIQEGEASGSIIELKNFNRQEVKQYVASILGTEDIPEFLVEEFFSRTEGNPLLLTEILQSLIHSHQIFDEQGRWSSTLLKEVGIDFNKLQVPKTITEYCKTKFESLTPGAQKLLSLLSIAKAPLHKPLLPRLEVTREDLEVLENQGLVKIDSEHGGLKLTNPNFSEWVPEHLSPEKLSQFHQQLADIFQLDSSTHEVALYHDGMGQGEPAERFQKLMNYGENLLMQFRPLEAANVFALSFPLATDQEKKVQATLGRVRAYFRAGHHNQGLKILEELQDSIGKQKDNPEQWRWAEQAYREMVNLYLKEGRLDLARDALQSGRVLLTEHEDNPTEQMVFDNFKASILLREGKLQEAEEIGRQAFERWKKFSVEEKKEVQNNELATIYLSLGKGVEAKEVFSAHAEFFHKIGNTYREAYSIYGLAESFYLLQKYDEAIRHYQKVVQISRDLKNKELLFHAFNGLGNIAFFKNEWQEAARFYEDALELAQHLGKLESTFAIGINLALVFRLQGDARSAQMYLRHVIDTLEVQSPPTLHQLQFLTQAHLELGNLHLETFNWIEARDSFRDAAHLIRIHSSLHAFRFSSSCGWAEAAIHLKLNREAKSLIKDMEKGNLNEEEKQEFEKVKKLLEGEQKTGTKTVMWTAMR